MHVHIANIGEHPEPVKNGVRGIGNIDFIYLLYSEKFLAQAEDTKSGFVDQGYGCEMVQIDGFDFQEIVDRIYEIYNHNNERNTRYSINITGGTNLMAAAACSTAFFTGAKIYYVLYNPNDPNQSLSERLIEVPTPKIPDVKHLKDHEKSIMKILDEGNRENNSTIADSLGMSRQLCGRYIHNLEDMGLVETSIGGNDRRFRQVTLTREGKMILGWF